MERFETVSGSEEDFYVLLGVSSLASYQEIKEAYRRRAFLCHPDKNANLDATEQFQKLGRAWETLRDARKRKEYDSQSLSQRRLNVDCEIQRQWQASRRSNPNAGALARTEKGRLFRGKARDDYRARLKSWNDFQHRQWDAIKHYQVLVHRYEKQLNSQMKESQDTMVEKFNAAISLSEANGKKVGDHNEVVKKLMEARRIYLLNLNLAGQATRGRMKYLLEELATIRRSFEEEEYRQRQIYVREALDLLELEDVNTPLFTIIDRRRQASNHWKALGRIRPGVLLPLLERSESPWHQDGAWVRIRGEHTCGRCAKSAFHIIAGIAAARCPGCGTIVCNNCHHDLELLREFDNWVCSDQDVGNSLFSLEFEGGSGPIETWDSNGSNGMDRTWA